MSISPFFQSFVEEACFPKIRFNSRSHTFSQLATYTYWPKFLVLDPILPAMTKFSFLFFEPKGLDLKRPNTAILSLRQNQRKSSAILLFPSLLAGKLKAMASTAEESSPIKNQTGIITINSQRIKEPSPPLPQSRQPRLPYR